MRTPFEQYPEYHTSADDLTFVSPAALGESLSVGLGVLDVLEHDGRYLNQNPNCEPQLGRRGLYRSLGGTLDRQSPEQAMLWVLNLSDGSQSLLDVAERSGLSFAAVRAAADALVDHGLLKPPADQRSPR
jgi:aminopeptidase-like protein